MRRVDRCVVRLFEEPEVLLLAVDGRVVGPSLHGDLERCVEVSDECVGEVVDFPVSALSIGQLHRCKLGESKQRKD